MAEAKRRQRAYEQETSLPATADEGVTIDLKELAYRILDKWKLVVCVALLFAVATGVYTSFFITPMYEATAIIYVYSNKDSVINMSDLQLGSALTADYLKVFKMWEVHNGVIKKLSNKDEGYELPYSISDLQEMVTVVNEADTRMLDITVHAADPIEAQMIANAYAEVGGEHIHAKMGIDQPSVISEARKPANPYNISLKRNVVLGFILGGMLVAGGIALQTLLDDKYKTAEDIRRYTGLTVLAVVPDETEAEVQKKGAKRK